MDSWEFTAGQARTITNNAPLVLLNKVKKEICEEIAQTARQGEREIIVPLGEYYKLSCLEDWCNIYNWLMKLGYEVEDNSGRKVKPCFIVKW